MGGVDLVVLAQTLGEKCLQNGKNVGGPWKEGGKAVIKSHEGGGKIDTG